MSEPEYKKFVGAMVILAKLLYLLKDKFFAQKLYDKLTDFITGYVKFSVGKNTPGHFKEEAGAAQSATCKELILATDLLLELLEYLEHHNAVNLNSLRLARRNLLLVKLDLIKYANKTKIIKTADKEKQEIIPENLIKHTSSGDYLKIEDKRLSANKEKIIYFIKKFPSARTKEIIEEFSVLSARTVKRNLSELIQDGLLRKSVKNRAVFYSAI